jgi:hypothetical protein
VADLLETGFKTAAELKDELAAVTSAIRGLQQVRLHHTCLLCPVSYACLGFHVSLCLVFCVPSDSGCANRSWSPTTCMWRLLMQGGLSKARKLTTTYSKLVKMERRSLQEQDVVYGDPRSIAAGALTPDHTCRVCGFVPACRSHRLASTLWLRLLVLCSSHGRS